MDTPHTVDSLRVLVARGEEMGRFLESDVMQTALTITRARLYEDCMGGACVAIREEARAEGRALERLMDSFYEIQQNGIVAREAIRLMDEA